MKSLKELRSNPLMLAKQESSLGMLKYLWQKNIDMEVYLPSYNVNLQRGNVWELWQKQELIMSILMRRFIPQISLMVSNIDSEELYQVIDGKQRLTAMIDFIYDQFHLEFDGIDYKYSELPQDYKNVISGHIIPAFIIYDGDIDITDDDKIEWFKLINFNQTQQDIKHLDMLNNLKMVVST